MEAFLNVYAPIALTIFAVGVTLRVGRWLKALVIYPSHRGRNRTFPVTTPDLGLIRGAKEVLVGPVAHFHARSNKPWSRGYALYHTAIITESTGYALATFILLPRVLMGQPVPDVAHHLEHSFNYSPANLLAIIFGSGEKFAAQALFGSFAPIIMTVTWVAVMFAVVGNLHLLYTLLRRRNGAVVTDIDAASSGTRTKGRLTWDRLTVRLIIFTIIWTALLSRLEIVPGIVFVHAALGVTLLALFPFTYLFHMLFNFVALYYAARRRSIRAIA